MTKYFSLPANVTVGFLRNTNVVFSHVLLESAATLFHCEAPERFCGL